VTDTTVSRARVGGKEKDPPKGGRGGRTFRGAAASRTFLAAWWPLVALLVLAAALRLSTVGLQSFWYDEAYVPAHTLHPSLAATLRSVVHRENTPPLWYLLVWAWSRLAGTGEVALRLPSALAGIATVAIAWGLGQELAGRRAAVATATLVACSPLMVWYSQEARAYALFVTLTALAAWCCLRADAAPTPGRLAAFAASAAAALATHYFAVFLVAPMCLWLLRPRRTAASSAGASGGERNGPDPAAAHPGATRRRPPPRGAWAAIAVPAVVAAALVPLALAQGGHGTQWIGAWALASRLETIPQYYLTGYSGAPLGHGLELLVALEILAAVGYGLWRVLTPRESEGALLALGLAACGVGIPVVAALAGADYLAPRNVLAAMVPLTAGIAVIAAARRTGRTGLALVAVVAVTSAALTIDVDLSPRLQRGDWRGLAHAIGRTGRPRAITTVELGSAPLEYYLPPLRNLGRGAVVRVSEIDETGYAPLRPGADEPPAPGFHLVQRQDVNGMLLYRFLAPTPRTVPEAALRAHVIAEGHPEVLVTGEKH
jgi:mannosyltransferase